MVSIYDIIKAIENEDMIEAHRLVRERKQRKNEIATELNALAPIVMTQGGGHSEEIMHRAMNLMVSGQIQDAQAILEEQMTPEQIKFGNLILELIGFEGCQKEVSTGLDLSAAQAAVENAFKGES